jgi:hypothetical protein
MSKKNKFYWLEGVTEKGTRKLLTDENSKFAWLRSQRNRRVLIVMYTLGLVLVSLMSYYQEIKRALSLSVEADIIIFSVTVMLILILVVAGYSFIHIAVRGIADAPDEMLDERQIQIRNTSFRYAYLHMGNLVAVLFLLMFFGPEVRLFEAEGNDGSYLMIAAMFSFASAPSMILAWREKDI